MCAVQLMMVTEVMRYDEDYERCLNALRPSSCGLQVRRKLFQDQPRETMTEDAEAVLRGLREHLNREAVLRWNFDFLKERPLPGRYQWVPVEGGDAGAAGPESGEIARSSTGGEERRDEHLAKRSRPAGSRQPKITDYMAMRKRRNSDGVRSTKIKPRRASADARLGSTVVRETSASSSDA